MKEELIKHIGFNELCDIIEKTKSLLILSLPNIDEAIAHSIIDFKPKNNLKNIKIITDNSENNFRNSFGEISTIDMLEENGIEMDYTDPAHVSVTGKGHHGLHKFS